MKYLILIFLSVNFSIQGEYIKNLNYYTGIENIILYKKPNIDSNFIIIKNKYENILYLDRIKETSIKDCRFDWLKVEYKNLEYFIPIYEKNIILEYNECYSKYKLSVDFEILKTKENLNSTNLEILLDLFSSFFLNKNKILKLKNQKEYLKIKNYEKITIKSISKEFEIENGILGFEILIIYKGLEYNVFYTTDIKTENNLKFINKYILLEDLIHDIDDSKKLGVFTWEKRNTIEPYVIRFLDNEEFQAKSLLSGLVIFNGFFVNSNNKFDILVVEKNNEKIIKNCKVSILKDSIYSNQGITCSDGFIFAYNASLLYKGGEIKSFQNIRIKISEEVERNLYVNKNTKIFDYNGTSFKEKNCKSLRLLKKNDIKFKNRFFNFYVLGKTIEKYKINKYKENLFLISNFIFKEDYCGEGWITESNLNDLISERNYDE